MRQILIVARQTLREAIRNKILFIFIILSLIAICCSIFMPVVGGDEDKIKIVESTCLRSITFFGMLAAIMLSASSIPSDIENKLLWTITTKPISRANLILGKIVGFAYIIGLLLLIMGSAAYALIKITASSQNVQNGKPLLAREQYNPSDFQITGELAGKIGSLSWVEGGGKGASVWNFEGLCYRERSDDLEIETQLLVESNKSLKKKIPLSVKIINTYTGNSQMKLIDVYDNKKSVLKLDGKSLEGSEKLTIVVSPKNPGDYAGITSNSLRIFLGKKSFEYNYLKGLAIISAQFFLMVAIATLGSTFLSLPVNILLCLFVFFCGNIIDFMRDLSTVINIFETREHSHGLSSVVKEPNAFVLFMDYVLKKPLLALSYILPNFKKFNIENYLIDSVNIPYKKVFISFGYTVLYAMFCLPVSFIVFKRREIA